MHGWLIDVYLSLLSCPPFCRATRAEQVLEENNQFLVTAKNSPVPVQVQEVLRDNSHGIYK